MAALVWPNGTELTIRGTYHNSRPWACTLHMHRLEQSPQEVARDVLNNWQDHIMPVLSVGVTLADLSYVDQESVSGIVGTILPDPAKPVVGGLTGNDLPANVALLVHKVTERRRGFRDGRMYLPGVWDQGVGDDGTLGSGYEANVNEALEDFFSGINNGGQGEGDTAQPVVVHTRAGVYQSFSTIDGLVVDPLVATQRRQLRG